MTVGRWTDGLTEDRQKGGVAASSKHKKPIYTERAMLFGCFHSYILEIQKNNSFEIQDTQILVPKPK